MNRHRLVVDPSVLKYDYETIQGYPSEERIYYSFGHQLTRITRERGSLRHDDRLDVVAIAAAYWTERMSSDADEQILQRKDEQFEKELQGFVKSFHEGPLSGMYGGEDALVGFNG
jgi:hypothetical protein